MTLIGICGRCVEESPPGATLTRQNLRRGPDGQKLCPRHANEEWDKHETADEEV